MLMAMGPLHWESGTFLTLAQRNLWLILSCCCFLSPQTICRAFLVLLVQKQGGKKYNRSGVSVEHRSILPWEIILQRALSAFPAAGDVCPSLESLGELPHHHGRESLLQSWECGVAGQPAVPERGQCPTSSAPNMAFLPFLRSQGQVSTVWAMGSGSAVHAIGMGDMARAGECRAAQPKACACTQSLPGT